MPELTIPAGQRNKRRRNVSDVHGPPSSDPADPAAGAGLRSSPVPSSLPPSSPPMIFDELEEGDDEAVDPHAPDAFVDEDEELEEAEFDEDLLGLGLGEDEDEGENLFAENMAADYTTNAALDTYDYRNLDETEQAKMTVEQRQAVEARLARRDRREQGQAAPEGARRRRQRAPAFLLSDDDHDPALEEERLLRGGDRRRNWYDERPQADQDPNTYEDVPLADLMEINAPSLSEWLTTDHVRRVVAKHFKNFLMTFVDEKTTDSVYGPAIKTLGAVNSESLVISYLHLLESKPVLAHFLLNAPSEVLPIFDDVAMDTILIFYPQYERIHSEVHVRIVDLPTSTSLRDLRQENLNQLVRVSGVVTRRSGVMPQLKFVRFDCGKCGAVLGPFHQDMNKEVKISFCANCESKGPFRVNSEQTVYRNYQKMTLQESPGTVPAGRLPRHREIILLWDLIDSATPGEEIEVTGIYRNNYDAALNAKNGFPVFSTVIEANHINKKQDMFASFRLTENDVREIRKLSRDERIVKKLIKSIAPSIYGHDDIKTALALALFGGVPKNVNGKHRIRGDINILMLGDPGTAKSQFLKYVEKTAHRAVFTTGQGASAVGLTASVRKDPVTKEWTLEGGALVLADKGVCMIDEFDKMNDADRTSIHEAMEQQSISISKAGIVTTLHARCAVIAAANPIRGRYNPTIPFSQNVELTEPILSRFDILCVVKDAVDPVKDELLARFVVSSHRRSHPSFDVEVDELQIATLHDAEIIPQDILRKYIMYAREKCRPQLSSIDQDRISRLYADLRRESSATGSYPITPRHLESIIRMSEASAKMALREQVRKDDVDLAISVTVASFVSAQKMSVKRTLERSFRKYINIASDNQELLAFSLGSMIKQKMMEARFNRHQDLSTVKIKMSDFEERARALNIFDVAPFLKSKVFKNNGYSIADDMIAKSFVSAAA